MSKKTKALKKSKKPGPKAETLKIEASYKDAIALTLQKKKPIEGWPK